MPRVQVYVHNYRGTHQDKEEEVEKTLMHQQLICWTWYLHPFCLGAKGKDPWH